MSQVAATVVMSSSPDLHSAPGAVELREDVPLKPSALRGSRLCGARLCGARLCGGGPRLILAAFAALSLAVTVALLTQIYAGDYEVVPHGSVSSSAAQCSGAGVAALRAGGRAADAAVAAALCLAVLAPHRTSLDASGSLIYWEYRSSRTQLPTVVEWGGPEPGGGGARAERPPRLVAALAELHRRRGALPWADVLQPAVALARAGHALPAGAAAAAAARGLPGYAAAQRSDPALADYLAALQRNTSSELCASWRCAGAVRWAEGAAPTRAGAWRVWGAGAGGALALPALQSALAAANANATDSVDTVLQSVVASLQQQAAGGAAPWPGGVASGLAVVDPRDTYVALVTGLSTPFGSGAGAGVVSPAAWTRDEPATPLDLAPAIIVDQHVCGTRYVMGAESASALAEGAAAVLLAPEDGAVDAVERARTLVLPGGRLLPEPAPPALPEPASPTLPAPPALPALNFVQQRGDALLSHADSRGGGVAARF